MFPIPTTRWIRCRCSFLEKASTSSTLDRMVINLGLKMMVTLKAVGHNISTIFRTANYYANYDVGPFCAPESTIEQANLPFSVTS